MKASEIVTQMTLLLPQLTDKFTNDVPVNSLTRSGTVITAACDEPHLLKPGNAVGIVGAITPITISDLKRTGVVGTLVTAADHDVTSKGAQPTITMSGSATSEFNGTFAVIDAPDRRTIRFMMENSGPTTGDPASAILEDGESVLRRYNATYPVLETPTLTTFTFAQADATIPNPVGTIVARTKPRVAQAVDPDRVISLYTEKEVDELWAFVVLEDVAASKSRDIRSDAIDGLQRGSFFRQQVTQPFTIYLLVPTSNSASGTDGRDQAEDLFRDICRSVLFGKFGSGLSVGQQGPVQFVNHGTFRYDTAVYVHAFSFQQTVDLGFEDTVGPDVDVAFRTIDLRLTPQLEGTQFLTSSAIDLDPGFEEQDFSMAFPDDAPQGEAARVWLQNSVRNPIEIANAWSIAAWVDPRDLTVDDRTIISIRETIASNANRILIRQRGAATSEPLNIEVYDSAGVQFKDLDWRMGDENPLVLGSFQFLVFTFDGATVRLYYNGVEVLPFAGSIDDPGTMTDTNRQVAIGARLDGLGDQWVGRIHSEGIWKSTLTEAEALALFNEGDGRAANWYADFGAYASSDDLVHWWRPGLDPNDLGRDHGVAAVPIDVGQNAVGEFVLVKVAP